MFVLLTKHICVIGYLPIINVTLELKFLYVIFNFKECHNVHLVGALEDKIINGNQCCDISNENISMDIYSNIKYISRYD